MSVAIKRNAESIAIYALSADPVTYGHINIIERAAKSFDHLIVAIGLNPVKNYLFDAETRLALVEQCIQPLSNVSVQSFRGLLVDFAYEQNAAVIIKGVRNAADFDYENVLHQVGESQHLGIDTHLLFAEQQYAHISSSTVKGLQFEQGFIQEYVPLPVKVALEQKLSNQVIIGVTGGIASGKSTLCESLVHYGEQHDIAVHNIDLDTLAHELLADDSAPYAQQLREDIIANFGMGIMENGAISRSKLGEVVFQQADKMMRLNMLMMKPLLLKLRRAIYQKQGVILLNAALLAEANMLELCNNRVIMLQTDPETQLERLIKRGHDNKHAQHRITSQLDNNRKETIIENSIESHNFGKLWLLSSNTPFDAQAMMTSILAEVGDIAVEV